MPRKQTLPYYDHAAGRWHGGDSRTLYAFRDKRTHHVTVRPGGRGRTHFSGIGPECEVNVATHDEAEANFQSPLHHGWKVREQYEIGSESHRYKQLLNSVTRISHFSNFEADALTREIGRAYKNNRINDEERELLAAMLDARRG